MAGILTDFEVVHRKGKLHGNADALSRIPCTQCGRQEIMPSEAIAIVGATSLSSIEQENLRKLQMEDSLLGPIIQAKLVSVKPSQQEQRKCSRASRRLFQLWDQLSIIDGILHCRFPYDRQQVCDKLVVPKAMQEEILENVHAGVGGGHWARRKPCKS